MPYRLVVRGAPVGPGDPEPIRLVRCRAEVRIVRLAIDLGGFVSALADVRSA